MLLDQRHVRLNVLQPQVHDLGDMVDLDVQRVEAPVDRIQPGGQLGADPGVELRDDPRDSPAQQRGDTGEHAHDSHGEADPLVHGVHCASFPGTSANHGTLCRQPIGPQWRCLGLWKDGAERPYGGALVKTAPLGRVAEIVSGATPKTGVAEYWDGDVAWVTPADLSKLDGPYISATPRKITEAGVRSCATTILPEGSVLLSSRAPIGHVAINAVPMATNQGFKSLIPGPDLDAKYLYHWLKSKTDYLQSLGNGATFKELSKKTTEQIKVPLPGLPEQRRIAAILDHADAIRAKRRQVLAHLDSLTQSIFHDMFGEITKRTTLRELGVDFISGKNVLGDGTDAHPVNRVIKVSAISSGEFLPTEAKPMPRDYDPPATHRLRKGDILFGRASGSLELLGVTAVVDIEPGELYLPDKVWRLTTTPDGPVHPAYVLGVLRSAEARGFIRHNASGAAGVRNIGKAKLLEHSLPLPPVALQHKFAARISSINQHQAAVRRALATDDELFASLQSRAFRGEL